jgi:hypothetical protein
MNTRRADEKFVLGKTNQQYSNEKNITTERRALKPAMWTSRGSEW